MPTIANMSKVNGIVISGAPAVPDAHTLIATATASSSATLSFTLGLDSLYDAYEFRFVNMHPAASGEWFFQVNSSGGSGFNETITSTHFRAYIIETDESNNGVGYRTEADQAQGTGYQQLSQSTAGGSGFDDASVCGVLTLYAPSSTTYVKHFTSRAQSMGGSPVSVDAFAAGYINTTSAIDEISFKFDSGNIDAGEIKMYGVAKS
tara:strand:+ start:193 stop:810 length:618 start_codon:yes stop_codon:yes gene_type:complete